MNPTQERWLPVPGYEGYYEVSDHGNVRSVDRMVPRGDHMLTRRGRVLAPVDNGHGYPRVQLGRYGKYDFQQVHRLVLQAFVGPCPDGMEACHNDGDRSDARLSNLRWDTRSSNQFDRRLHGTDHKVNLTHCPNGHKYEHPNLLRNKSGARQCKACKRAYNESVRKPQLSWQEHADYQYERIMGSA